MIKLALVFAPPSKNYDDVIWSTKETPNPPHTAPSLLAAYIKKYSSRPTQISCINTQVIQDKKIRYFTDEEIIKMTNNSDIIGFTCLFNNQERILNIVKKIKTKDPKKIIILGGQNVSNHFMAEQILQQMSCVDYIVIGDGEEALLGIVEGKACDEIPNIVYRQEGKIKYSHRTTTDLNKIPLWNFENIFNKKSILKFYDHRTKLYKKLVKKYQGRTLGEVAVFSSKGCAKASGLIGQRSGYCTYCTSAGLPGNQMHPLNFWKQIKYLYNKYGIQDYFLADNIFGLNIRQLKMFLAAKKKLKVSDNIQFRAYTYPAILNSPQGNTITKYLKKVGVNNIFIGVETFNPSISNKSNKDPVTYSMVADSIKKLGDAGIDTFIPLMPGLPGETKKSLNNNLCKLKRLLKNYASVEYGKGKLTRIDVSPAMPLVGTAWHYNLITNKKIQKDYYHKTGKDIATDITPDFILLRKLSLKYYSHVTEKDINKFEYDAKKLCLKYLKVEMVGGFDLRRDSLRQNSRKHAKLTLA